MNYCLVIMKVAPELVSYMNVLKTSNYERNNVMYALIILNNDISIPNNILN